MQIIRVTGRKSGKIGGRVRTPNQPGEVGDRMDRVEAALLNVKCPIVAFAKRTSGFRLAWIPYRTVNFVGNMRSKRKLGCHNVFYRPIIAGNETIGNESNTHKQILHTHPCTQIQEEEEWAFRKKERDTM